MNRKIPVRQAMQNLVTQRASGTAPISPMCIVHALPHGFHDIFMGDGGATGLTPTRPLGRFTDIRERTIAELVGGRQYLGYTPRHVHRTFR